MKTFTWQQFKELVNSKEYVLSSRRGRSDGYNQVETGSTIIKLIQESKCGGFDWLCLDHFSISSETNQNIKFDEKTKTFHLVLRKYDEEETGEVREIQCDVDGSYEVPVMRVLDTYIEEDIFVSLYKAVDFS